MKRFLRPALRPVRCLLTGSLILTLSAGITLAAEMRKWTNLKGKTIEAKLLSVDAETVNLQLKNGSRASVPRDSLSAADQQYLTEYGGAKEMEIDPDAKISIPEKDMRFDPKTVVNREDKFVLPGEFALEFKMIESEHFFVMTSGSVRGGDTAELAERLWYGMSFYHPGFKAKWGDEKRAIFLCGDKEDYLTLGEYNARNLVLMGQGEAANNSKLTWPQASGSGLYLAEDICKEYNLNPRARAFDASDKTRFKRGVWNPFPAHCISGDILGEMMGGAGGGVGSDGYFAIERGHSYFKEIQLADETVTTMINADAYAGDEITKAGGFDDGRKWARTLRDLVKKGKVTPSLANLYAIKDPSNLTPELTVLMYGLSRYMQSTPTRMQKFSQFLDRVDTGRAIPQPIELAKIFGFDSVEAFETDWTEYLKGNDFK